MSGLTNGCQSPGAVSDAVADIAAGRMVVVSDPSRRRDIVDLVLAADHATAEAISFMGRNAGGPICLALTPERCRELGLEALGPRTDSADQTRFMTTIDARAGITRGISAGDRARTIQTAADPEKGRADITTPGHVHPIEVRAGGVLERPGYPEASVDLALLARRQPAGVICGIQTDDGSLVGLEDLEPYCRTHGLTMITVDDLVAYRWLHDELVERVVTTALPTVFGDFVVHGYRTLASGEHHLAIVAGELATTVAPVVSIHVTCVLGDALGSRACPCGDRLRAALARLSAASAGVVVYLSRDGASDAPVAHLGWDARHEALSLREVAIASQILHDLGVTSVRLGDQPPVSAREGLKRQGIRLVDGP
jgi:3,4-dihydroxy 2-butanone 4-phosphate synthase / GTP cyclohydrolase II